MDSRVSTMEMYKGLAPFSSESKVIELEMATHFVLLG
jgi:hypothetical protein